jgi:hypothetical protein
VSSQREKPPNIERPLFCTLPGLSTGGRGNLSLCREWSLVKQAGEELYLKLLHCRCWECLTCGPRRRKQLIAQACAGEPRTLLTLTAGPGAGATPEERHETLMRAWHLVVKRTRRLQGCSNVEYLWVVEATEAGQPHLHVLMRAPWIDQTLISSWLAELAGSPIVDIRRIHGVRQVVHYVAKYLTKAPARFGASKRYFASRGYGLEPATAAEKHPSVGPGWQLRRQSLDSLIWEYSACNWQELYDVLHPDKGFVTMLRGPPNQAREELPNDTSRSDVQRRPYQARLT